MFCRTQTSVVLKHSWVYLKNLFSFWSNPNKRCIETANILDGYGKAKAVEPKQALYWNSMLEKLNQIQDLVEPKQALYWNYLKVKKH